MTNAPCTRLEPGTNIRCGAESMAVIHLTLNGASYLGYVCDEHYTESRQLEWAKHVGIDAVPTPADDLVMRIDSKSVPYGPMHEPRYVAGHYDGDGCVFPMTGHFAFDTGSDDVIGS